MLYNSENFLDNIFLSYQKILYRFELLEIKTKNGNIITHSDLRQAVDIMIKKHPTCRWRSEKIRNRKYFILVEGYYWLRQVYFQTKKPIVDADIEFFESRIKQYEELLKIESNQSWWNVNMSIKELAEYFNKDVSTIRKGIREMCKLGNEHYKSYLDGQVVISNLRIEWLSKNIFKQKYLELLENYKMELTELYIKAGYPYDNFFGRN